MRIVVVICLLATLAACAETKSFLRYEATGERQVWPPLPESARYRYVGQLTGEDNIFAEESGKFKKIMLWLVGLTSSDPERVMLQRPQSGVVDDVRRRIYVTDVARGGVFVFDEIKGQLLFWNDAGRSRKFTTPSGIVLGDNGELFVADADLGEIIRLGPNGEPRGSFGEGLLKRPTGIARDPQSGRIYVSDTHAHNIKLFGNDGKLQHVIGQRGEGIGEFNFPTFLSFASTKLYVTDTLNSRIQVLNAEGQYVLKFGRRGLNVGDLPRPKGISVDRAGLIYVVESYYDHLLVYSSDGQLLLPIGGTGSEIGEFYLPSGVWTDARGRVYVADMFNSRVIIFEYVGDSLN